MAENTMIMCEQQEIVNIANAIREKTGSTSEMTLQDMATSVYSIGDVEGETVNITNLVSNPHFTTDLTDWTVMFPETSSAEVIDGVLCLDYTGNNTAQHIRQRGADQTAFIVGHKYYTSIRALFEGPEPYDVNFYFTGTNLTIEDEAVVPPTFSGWSTMSRISTLTAAPSSKYISFWAKHYATGVETAKIRLDDAVIVDLTATFGEGNEPDLATLNSYMSTQYPYGFEGTVELRLAAAGPSIEELIEKVEDLESKVISLETSSASQTGTVYPTLHDYYITNIANARPIYYNEQEANTLTFSMLSDIHAHLKSSSAYTNILKNVEASSAWAKIVNNDFIMLSGDLIVDYHDKATALGLVDDVVEMAEKHARCPVYTVKGNHDTNEGVTENIPAYRFTDKEFYLHANARGEKYGMVTDPEYPYGGYYYVDFPKQKIRMVCLNTSENNPNYDILTATKGQFRYTGVFSPNQVAWVKDVALRVDEGWAVMMISHIPPFQAENFYNRGTDNPALRTICENFAAGSGDFIGQGAREFIGHFSGHAHIDAYNKVGGLNYILVNCTTPEKRWNTSLDRTENEDKLSLNSFIIDRASRTVKCIKIGAAPADDSSDWVDNFTW